MSEPDIQYFGRDGTWVKPAGAACLTVVLKGGGSTIDADGTDNGYEGGGTSFSFFPSGGGGGAGIAAAPSRPNRVDDGELVAREFPADAWPAQVSVEVGKGGRPGGQDGYALIVTHLREPDDEKIRAYGRGQIPASELTDKELEMASDALDALDWS
jgi:hypothetical protein